MMTHKISLDPSLPLALLEKCPVYTPSPLRKLSFGSRSVWIKDETNRMGLGAFKALGGVYAVAQLIAQSRELSASQIESNFALKPQTEGSDLTFVCASAGNHGMAVAAGGQLFGAAVRIHLAHTVPEEFAIRLRDKGAEVVRSGATYEDSVQAAILDAESTGALHLADGSWPGYTEPPRLVMEGYTVIAEEMRVIFEKKGDWPTHVFLQAGVGGLAAAVAYMIRMNWKMQPEIIVVEPDFAPCLGQSALAGHMVSVEGPVSNMGRLDCKSPSMLAFDILRSAADKFVTISDQEAQQATEKAADLGVATTPSGAAGFAAALRDTSPDARPLVIFSEGALGDE